MRATRLPQNRRDLSAAVSVIDAGQIQRARQQLSLDESMAAVPGVFIQNPYNFAQDLRISIRGFGSRSAFGVRGIRILVDGIPETLADGQTQVDSIDLGTVDRIEVLRGSSSSIYGNASGGVLDIRSERWEGQSFVEARFSAGAFGFARHQLKGAGKTGKLNYFASYSDLDTDGHRAHSQAQNRQAYARLQYEINALSTLALSLSHTEQPVSNDPGGLTRAEAAANPKQARAQNVDFDAGEALDQQKLGLAYTRTSSDDEQLMLRSYFLQRDFSNKLPFTSGGAVVLDRHLYGAGVSYTKPITLAGNRSRLIAGIDYDAQRDDRGRFDNEQGSIGVRVFAQDEDVTSTGLFLQNEIAFGERALLNIGLRYDTIEFRVNDRFPGDGDDSGSRSLRQLSPMLGANFSITEASRMYVNIATSFQTPTSTEFANPDGSGGFNAALNPELANNYELGVRGHLGSAANFDIAIFQIDLADELIPFEISGSPGRDYYVNAGKSRRNGLELAIDGQTTSLLRWQLAYTHSSFEFTEFLDDNGNDYAGNTVPGVPRHHLFGGVELQYRRFFAAAEFRYVGDIVANNANTEKVDAYALGNLRVGWDRSFDGLDFSVFAGVHNLFDRAHTANVRINAFGGRYFEPGPGRNAYAGISLRYRYGNRAP